MRGLGITGHSESCPGSRVPSVRTLRELRESRGHRETTLPPSAGTGTGTILRHLPPFSATSETPELLTKICLCLGWTVAEMGQRILMGVLLSSGTISITQTFYNDQGCDIDCIEAYLDLKNIVENEGNSTGLISIWTRKKESKSVDNFSCNSGSIRKQLCVSR